MDVLTVSVKTAQTFEATTIREKGYLYHNASPHKTFWLQKVLEARNHDQSNWFLKCLNYHRNIRGGLLGGLFWRGCGLHQGADQSGQESGNPLGDTVTKCQKVTGDEGGSQKDDYSYGDKDTKQPEDV